MSLVIDVSIIAYICEGKNCSEDFLIVGDYKLFNHLNSLGKQQLIDDITSVCTKGKTYKIYSIHAHYYYYSYL